MPRIARIEVVGACFTELGLREECDSLGGKSRAFRAIPARKTVRPVDHQHDISPGVGVFGRSCLAPTNASPRDPEYALLRSSENTSSSVTNWLSSTAHKRHVRI